MRRVCRSCSSRAVLAVTAAVCSLLATACSDNEVKAQPNRLELTFDELETPGLAPGPLALTDSEGRTVEGELLAVDVGSIPLRPGVAGGLALMLPGDQGQADAVAALKIMPSDPDLFSPGEDSFTLGADIAWAGGGDGGANIVQRGLFSDIGQYKLQMDGGVPSCRVAGAEGEVLVKAERSLSPRSWHRLRCQRARDEVTLTVQPWDGDRLGDPETFTKKGPIGAVDFPTTTPFSVGAKLSASGSLVPKRPDQFHGLIDSVVVDVE